MTLRVLTTVLFLGAIAATISAAEDASCFSSNNATAAAAASSSPHEIYGSSKLEFALAMFHKLYDKSLKKNLFLSPLSIREALLMAYFGSRGSTESQLRRALRIDDLSKPQVVSMYAMDVFAREQLLNSSTSSASSTTTVRSANRVYFSVNETLRDCVKGIFPREISQVDFSDSAAVTAEVNEWVGNVTEGKVTEILQPGDINAKTRIAIVNSAYFRGRWLQQFKRSRTKLDLFYAAEDEVVPTLMMNVKGSFRRGTSEALQSYIVELPYDSSSLSMYILLPPFTPNALETTISRLNASSLTSAMEQMSVQSSLEVSLPKFRIEETHPLEQTFRSLGVVDLFSTNADLGDFSTKPEGLFFTQGVHKAVIDVDEEGATAAAATSIIQSRIAHIFNDNKFKCNHPFLFVILDSVNKDVSFLGVFRGPPPNIIKALGNKKNKGDAVATKDIK